MSPEGGPAQPDAEKGLTVDDDDFLAALDDVDAEWDNDEDDEWGNDDDDVATLMNVVTKADIEVARAPILRRSLSQHDRDVLREEQRTWAVQEAAALPQLVPTQLLLKVLMVEQDHTIQNMVMVGVEVAAEAAVKDAYPLGVRA